VPSSLVPCPAVKILRALVLLALPLALLATACGGGSGGGGGSKLSDGDVVVVGRLHISFAQLDRAMAQAEQSYKAQKQEFPKAGSPEYRALQDRALTVLVQRAQLAQKAEELDITITQKQIEDGLKQIKQQYFAGSDQKYRQELKKQGITDAEVRDDVKARLISEAIADRVTSGVKVTEPQLRAYYKKNLSRFTQPETREVRHILAKNKATADRLYRQLQGGADFATLAEKFSQDPGSKAQGGKLTITRGQTVPEFDAAAFKLKTGELSRPVKTQFGWHIIYAEKATTPKKVRPFATVKEVIRQQLVSDQRNDKLNAWYEGVKKEFASKTTYAKGFEPLQTGTTTGTTTTG
jgi:parvulin-like peptidyl-prolyl isomerase